MCLVLAEARRRYWVPWDWGYRQLGEELPAAVDMLEISLGPLEEHPVLLTAEPSL